MTSDELEIERLKTVPPRVSLTRWGRVRRWLRVLLDLVAVTALLLGLFASLAGASTASCLNTNLGARSAPSRLDAVAHEVFAADTEGFAGASRDFARAIETLFQPVPVAERPAALASFHGAVDSYLAAVTKWQADTIRYAAQLSADQAARNAQPLGKC